MSLCGCYPQCSCQLNVQPPELLSLTGNGDPVSGGWLLTAQETVFAAANVDGAVNITPGGAYGHEPQIDLKLDSSPEISLTTSASGLRAELISAPSGSGGVPTGTSLSYHGPNAPAGYLLEYGQLVDIVDYQELFDTIGHVGNGGVPPGGGQFRIPDGRGLFDLGRDDMGGVAANNVTGATTLGATGGNEDAELGVTNLPAHTHTEVGSHSHPASDTGHTHPAGSTTSSGSHSHGPATQGRRFITAEGSPPTTGTIQQVRVNIGGSDADIYVDNNDPNAAYGQKENGLTDTQPAHTHGFSISAGYASIVVGENTDLVVVGGGGNGAAKGAAFLILPPYRVVNKIIKI